MLLPTDFDAPAWEGLFAELDDQLTFAIRRYIRRKSLTPDQIAAGFAELCGLREGREPDYTRPGLPVAYAFRYLPKRVACILGALTRIEHRGWPRRVLDIGSGSGATSVALNLLAYDGSLEIDAVEPSRAMRDFAELFPLDSNVALHHFVGDLERVMAGNLRLRFKDYDLLVMSACLPYNLRVEGQLAMWLRSDASFCGAIVAIEPEAKAEQIDGMHRSLYGLRRCSVHQYCCHDLPTVLHRPLKLAQTTELLERYYPDISTNPCLGRQGLRMLGNPPYPVLTWNSGVPSPEKILLCEQMDRGGNNGRISAIVGWLREHW